MTEERRKQLEAEYSLYRNEDPSATFETFLKRNHPDDYRDHMARLEEAGRQNPIFSWEKKKTEAGDTPSSREKNSGIIRQPAGNGGAQDSGRNELMTVEESMDRSKGNDTRTKSFSTSNTDRIRNTYRLLTGGEDEENASNQSVPKTPDSQQSRLMTMEESKASSSGNSRKVDMFSTSNTEKLDNTLKLVAGEEETREYVENQFGQRWQEREEKKRQEEERNRRLEEKYALIPASVRMSNLLFPDEPQLAADFAAELQRQGYDRYILENHIDVDDMTQMDEKTVEDMYHHLHRFFVKRDYQEFEADQLAKQKAGILEESTGGKMQGIKMVHDSEYVRGHGDMGAAEKTAKTNLNDYSVEKLNQSPTTAWEAFSNQLTKKGYEFEQKFGNLFNLPEDDVFGRSRVEEAVSDRRKRAQKEHPMATFAGFAANQAIDAVYGGIFTPRNAAEAALSSAEYATAFQKVYDKLPEKVKDQLFGTVDDLFTVITDAVKEGKSAEDAAADFAVKTIIRYASPSQIKKYVQDNPDVYPDGFDPIKELKDLVDAGKNVEKSIDKGFEKMVDSALRPAEDSQPVPLTEEQQRYYRQHYDSAVQQAMAAVREEPEFGRLSDTDKYLVLFDARKKAEDALRREARA